MTEYGPDIAASKDLIKNLDLQKYVIWIPKQKRIEIFKYIEICDIGVSEFAEMFWGGCGWNFFHLGNLFFII